MQKRIILASLVAIAFLCLGISTIVPAKTTLIPRSVIFGNPVKALAYISPDGALLSYLAPLTKDSKVLNIWIKSINAHDDRPLTSVTDRSIQGYMWAPNGNQILYVQDTNGDENWRLYGVDIHTKKVRCYTPYEKVTTQIIACNKFHPTTILIGLNKDNPELHDVYELDLTTGDLKLLAKNPGNVSNWHIDRTFKVRGMTISADNGGQKLLIRKDDQSPFETIRTWSYEDLRLSGVVGFSYDGNTLYLLDTQVGTHTTDTSSLIKIDLTTGKTELIAHDPEFDIQDVHRNSDTYEVEAVSYGKDNEEWQIFSPEFKKTYDALKALGKGNLYILNGDNARKKLVVCLEKDNRSGAYYLYDKEHDKIIHLFDSRPELNKYTLAKCEPISFTSRDGLTIRGYLTRPPHLTRKNLPLVLVVHGGPNARDSWGYDGEAQWLANRGYAVLQVNFRGSTGYGKKFVNAANKEWGGKMHNDLIDAVTWAINQGIADPKRVAIYGGSYGGYAALVGATFTPDIFKCAIDLVGPSNLLTFLNSIPPYWELYRDNMYKTIGHPQTDEELLKQRSPLFHVDKIKCPLLIAQGAHDPRVKKAESEQIVEALKKHGICHEYMLFEDEGHGFVKDENRKTFYAKVEEFLADHLGGSCER
jgi:dipeptidyl aminopeptidase/acylaminoacyl peptidase